MKLTGKAKEDFEKWMNPTGMPSDYKFGQNLGGNFESLPDSMKWGVIQDFADSVGYWMDVYTSLILSTPTTVEVYCFSPDVWCNSDEGVGIGEFETRPEARTAAISKFNELYNKNEKTK